MEKSKKRYTASNGKNYTGWCSTSLKVDDEGRDSVLIGDTLVTLTRVHGTYARLSIRAPEDMKIRRMEKASPQERAFVEEMRANRPEPTDHASAED